MAAQLNNKTSTTTRPSTASASSTTEWVGFPTTSLLNPMPSPYNFTNSLSKTVMLIADSNYVSKHTAAYLDTTLHVSGFKVTKFTSISSAPLMWTKPPQDTELDTFVRQHQHSQNVSTFLDDEEYDTDALAEDMSDSDERSNIYQLVHDSKYVPQNKSANNNETCTNNDDQKTNDHKEEQAPFWEYELDLNDFDCILIPAQIHGDIWSVLTEETKHKLQRFVEKGGCLIACHFRATNILNAVGNVSWHEVSVKIGASFHVKKEKKECLNYVNDVRGIVNVQRNDVIYKTGEDFTTVAFKQYGEGMIYYIGHDFSAIWERAWNKILFSAIKKLLSNSEQELMNLNFDKINIEAFKNLNIQANERESNSKDIYLDEFEPDFKELENESQTHDPQSNGKLVATRTALQSKDSTQNDVRGNDEDFNAFGDLDAFDESAPQDTQQTKTKQVSPDPASIGYVQMDENGVITMNDGKQFKLELTANDGDEIVDIQYNTNLNARKLPQIQESPDGQDEDQDDNESLEEVD